jgi:hypothetical protein
MERRVNKRLDNYITTFKDDIRNKVTSLAIQNEGVNNLLQYIYDYDRLVLTKDDFMKRKRVKNAVPYCDRCGAKRANGEQCTRRKKDGDEYCGTHMKGTPHGVVDTQEDNKPTTQKVEVWAQDIQGIVYYIDKNMNVYQAEDIVSNKTNPKLIAKYVKNGDVYSIPSFGI